MLKRIMVAVIGIPLLILLLSFAPAWATVLLVAAMCGVGAYELMHAVTGEKCNRYLLYLTVAVAAVLPVLLFRDDTVFAGQPKILAPVIAAWLVFLFLAAILCYGTDHAVPFAHLTAAIFSGFLFPLMLSCLLRLRLMEFGQLLVWVPLAISFGSDTCALFAGMAFGRHKMAPLVSPHKTVEGGIGGLAGGIVGLLILKWIARAAAGVVFLAGWQVVVMGLVCSAISEIGDLSFSVIKREYGVKDYGNLLPGHGGVLDRFDSVTFVAPLVYFLMLMMVH